jgi:NADH dehydrogenase
VFIHLNAAVQEVTKDCVLLSDGETIPTHTVIWAGGVKASPLSLSCKLPVGRGGRIDVKKDLTVEGFPEIFVLGDFANIPSQDGKGQPQLGAVALQCGAWAAKNILHSIEGSPKEDFQYHDKGIMAIIGRNSAVAELGKRRYEIEGFLAFVAWLLVHAALLPTFRQKIETLLTWTCQYFTKSRALQLLDRNDLPRV